MITRGNTRGTSTQCITKHMVEWAYAMEGWQ